MPALKPLKLTGQIVWLGHVPDREAALASTAQDEMALSFAGPVGEDHGGLTRPSCSRVISQYPRGTEIKNTRQLSVVSAEELAQIAEAMGVDTLDPWLVGATMVVSGIPDFSHLPPSSRLQVANGATLTVDMQNRPCHLPAAEIDVPHPGKGRAFKAAARGLRGVTAWVEREGTARVGDSVTVHVPDQRAWAYTGE
ncbi:sulfurase [Thalassobacter stenotrophicus]|uniref:MOSC domain-containing protein n=1 Tax=Thalassobacter TaxID=266808 RepID=UPI00051E050E|nr:MULTISPECIES: MOSC domain-containing protein [Thalassobacter]KGK80645.1 sulfurase [Thalassobacter stenotrophicus]KGL02027.1 sulfurase [Thalassobacter sp. 16PALIMAR09]